MNRLSTNLHLYKSVSSLCVFSLLLSAPLIISIHSLRVRIFAASSSHIVCYRKFCVAVVGVVRLSMAIQRISSEHEHEHRQIIYFTTTTIAPAPEFTCNCCWMGNYFEICFFPLSTNYLLPNPFNYHSEAPWHFRSHLLEHTITPVYIINELLLC